jgi:hypothetical protein
LIENPGGARRRQEGDRTNDTDPLESQAAAEEEGSWNVDEEGVGPEFPEDGAAAGYGFEPRILEAYGEVEGIDDDFFGFEAETGGGLEAAGGLGDDEAVEGAETDEDEERCGGEEKGGQGEKGEPRWPEPPLLFGIRHLSRLPIRIITATPEYNN